MKKLFVVLAVLAMAVPSFANANLTAYWDFSTGSTADISGNGVAANGTLVGTAAIVANPLGAGSVLSLTPGGKMTTPAAAEPKFDSAYNAAIMITVYTPNPSGWWSYTAGKGGSGSPRIFADYNPNGNVYYFDYSDLARDPAGSGQFNSTVGAWGAPWAPTSGFHQLGAQIHPYFDGSTWGLVNEIYLDGVLVGQQTTQSMLEDSTSMVLTDMLFEIAPNADWAGMVKNCAVWNGAADSATWAGLYSGAISVQNANFVNVPEPCTIALLSLGVLALRRKK